MNFRNKLAAAAIASASVGGAADAATTRIAFGDITFSDSYTAASRGGTGTLSLEWDGVAIGGSILEFYFETDAAFDIVLTDYEDQGSAPDVSAFTLETTDGFFGLVLSQIDGVTDNCAILGTDCFPVTQSTSTGGLVPLAAQPGDTVLSGSAAGSYLFTFGESGSPASGSVAFEFRESSLGVVPLPASGLLLLGAMGGLALARRKRSV